jgi:hypothetical protein
MRNEELCCRGQVTILKQAQFPINEAHSIRYQFVTNRLCGLVVRVPGYRTEMYCASCEVRTEFIYVM